MLGDERFWMLETIREFALERFDAAVDASEVRRRHADLMFAIARSTAPGDDGMVSDIRPALAEREDLRAALDWADANDPVFGLELAVALQNLWNAAGPDEGMRRLGGLLDRAGPIRPELRADALRVYGGTADLAGHDELAGQLSEESLRLYKELGDDRGIADVEHMLAVSAWRREDWPRVRELTEHSLALASGRFAGVETTGLWLLGQLALADGDLERATELTRRSADQSREAGWSWWQSGQHHELLMLALRRDDLEEAEEEGQAALRLEVEQENRLWALYTIAGLAQVALARGDLERAGLLWGAAEGEGRRVPRWLHERVKRGGGLVEQTTATFATARENGRKLDIWDAATVALGDVERPAISDV
jgi:tetratricopeptide (TPR) repeat protein